MNIQAIIQALISLMQRKASGTETSVAEADLVVSRARQRLDIPAVAKMLSAWDLQLQRERGEVHLSQGAMLRMWEQAIADGQRHLRDIERCRDDDAKQDDTAQAESIATAVKRRLKGYAEAARAMESDASHAQQLTAMARADGFANIQALTAHLASSPAFCPCCGTPGSARKREADFECQRCGSVFSFAKPQAQAAEYRLDQEKLMRDTLTSVGYSVRRYNGAVKSQRFIYLYGELPSRAAFTTEEEAWAGAWKSAGERASSHQAIDDHMWHNLSVPAQALAVSMLEYPG